MTPAATPTVCGHRGIIKVTPRLADQAGFNHKLCQYIRGQNDMVTDAAN